jgi:predicted N-acyltransferase
MRSKLRFERLTREFLCELSRRMPDKVRYFIWRQEGRVIAFSLCMVEGSDLYAEYLGLDYTLALKLHLYHYAFRDVVTWAIANGYKNFRAAGSITIPSSTCAPGSIRSISMSAIPRHG